METIYFESPEDRVALAADHLAGYADEGAWNSPLIGHLHSEHKHQLDRCPDDYNSPEATHYWAHTQNW